MIRTRGVFALVVALAGTPAATATADVVTDWDDIGVKSVQPIGLPPPIKPGLLFRAMAMMHLAMFNAVNAIEPRYQPYRFQSKAELGASEEAAAASAAANVLAGIVPNADLRATLTSYLAAVPDGDAKDRGQTWRRRRRKDAGVARRRRIKHAERVSADYAARRLCPNRNDNRLGMHHDDAVRNGEPFAISSWPAPRPQECGVGEGLQ